MEDGDFKKEDIMQINTKEILASLAGAWFIFRMWWNRIEPMVKPIIEEAEQLALDGKIDANDRKKLVMSAISILEKDGKIKLNFLERLLIGKIVDIVAKKLPDWNVSKNVKEVMVQAQNGGAHA